MSKFKIMLVASALATTLGAANVASGQEAPMCDVSETDSDGDCLKNLDDACPERVGALEANGCPSDVPVTKFGDVSVSDGPEQTLPAVEPKPATVPPVEHDEDGDGIDDSVDNCINASNSSQEDEDQDGWGDICDTCPELHRHGADGQDVDSDGNGCPDGWVARQYADADKDGVLDKDDKCPNEPERMNGREDTDGCPDLNPGFMLSVDARHPCKDKKKHWTRWRDTYIPPYDGQTYTVQPGYDRASTLGTCNERFQVDMVAKHRAPSAMKMLLAAGYPEDKLVLERPTAGFAGVKVWPVPEKPRDGISCWDWNENGYKDHGDDRNQDGVVDMGDCAGSPGVAGSHQDFATLLQIATESAEDAKRSVEVAREAIGLARSGGTNLDFEVFAIGAMQRHRISLYGGGGVGLIWPEFTNGWDFNARVWVGPAPSRRPGLGVTVSSVRQMHELWKLGLALVSFGDLGTFRGFRQMLTGMGPEVRVLFGETDDQMRIFLTFNGVLGYEQSSGGLGRFGFGGTSQVSLVF